MNVTKIILIYQCIVRDLKNDNLLKKHQNLQEKYLQIISKKRIHPQEILSQNAVEMNKNKQKKSQTVNNALKPPQKNILLPYIDATTPKSQEEDNIYE